MASSSAKPKSRARRSRTENGHLVQVWPSAQSGTETTVDIVAVHGLGTYSPKTWEADDRHGGNRTVNWLQDEDMLPSIVPNARIFTFDYDADYHCDAPVTNLLALGDKLLQIITNHRQKDGTAERPLIFIGSCFGGLVIIQALVDAAASGNPHSELFLSTVAVVFLGTPLQGTKIAKYETWHVMVEGILGKDSSPLLIRDLTENSEKLYNLKEAFAGIALNNSLKIHCFYETKKTTLLKAILPGIFAKIIPGSKAILVTMENAHISGPPKTALDVSHSMMNKFSSPKDRGYELVSGCIWKFVKDAPQLLKGRRLREDIAPWTVPFARDYNFVGRKDVIDRLFELTLRPDSHNRVALTGFGGMGKTGIATEFAYKLRERKPNIAVLWVYATSKDRFEKSFQDIAEALDIPERAKKSNDILALVTAWLKRPTTTPWIIILDNADNEVILRSTIGGTESEPGSKSQYLVDFLPQTKNGAIVVTSRNTQVARDICGNNTLLEVDNLEMADAVLLMKRKLPKEKAEKAKEDEIATLVEELDRIPLTITHATAYITKESITASIYLKLFQQNKASLLDKELKDLRRDSSVPDSVVSTWYISFQQIEKLNVRATQLLSLMSVLDRQAIPDNLVRDGFCADPSEDQAGALVIEKSEAWNLQQYYQARGLLLAFAFVSGVKAGENTGDAESYYMHRLVQDCVQHWLAMSDVKTEWTRKALRLLSLSYPFGNFENWKKCAEYLPHAKAIIQATSENSYDNVDKAVLLKRVGWYESRRGHLKVGEEFIRKSVALLEMTLGADDFQTLEDNVLLVNVLSEQKQFAAAEQLSQQLLPKLQGPSNSTLLADVKTRLAWALRQQGRHEEALGIAEGLVEEAERALGPEHRDVGLYNIALAGILSMHGRHGEAEKLLRRVVVSFNRNLGSENPDTVSAVQHLASALGGLKQHKESEILYRQALKSREKILGLEHPVTLLNIYGVGVSLSHQGQHKEAEEYYKRALAGQEKMLGMENPDTLTSLQGLGLCLANQGQHKEAEECYERALAGQEKVLGRENPKTHRSLKILVECKRNLGKEEEADTLEEEYAP